jgi:hypothetical protein
MIKGGLNIGMAISLSMTKIKISYLFCKRCFNQWIPRSENLPKVCPRCNSPYWNKERQRSVDMKKEKDDRDLGELTELASEVHKTRKEKKK